jgi:hypothetical protein
VGDAFASDFLQFCADVEWNFLAEEARELLVKATVERREALVIHLGAGHSTPARAAENGAKRSNVQVFLVVSRTRT